MEGKKRKPLAPKDNRPTASSSSSSSARSKGKGRALDEEQEEAGLDAEEAEIDPPPAKTGWLSILSRSGKKPPISTASHAVASPSVSASTSTSSGIGRRIVNPATRRRGPTISFSDEESLPADEHEFDGEEERRKRRRVDKGGAGQLDLCPVEDAAGSFGSQVESSARGSAKKGERKPLKMEGEREAEVEGENEPATVEALDFAVEDEDEDSQPEPSTLNSSYYRANSRSLPPQPALLANGLPSSSPTSHSSASSAVVAETLQEQLVGRRREPIILVPDSSPAGPPQQSDDDGEVQTDEDDEDEEAVLESLVRNRAGGGADDSGFAEVSMMDVKPMEELVLSSSPVRITSAIPREVVDPSLSSSPVRSGPRPLRSATSLNRTSSSSSGSGDSGDLTSTVLGRSASGILMPPPPVPIGGRKKLKKGAPSSRAAAEAEAEAKAQKKREKEARKQVKGKRVLVEDTQEGANASETQTLRDAWAAQPLDVICDETQSPGGELSAQYAFFSLDSHQHFYPPDPFFFPSSSLPPALPTPRDLAVPISSPERFYPTQLRRALRGSPSHAVDSPPSSSAPANLESSPFRPEPVSLVGRAAATWAATRGAWEGARPSTPPPPPEARQAKLGEFFTRAPGGRQLEDEEIVEESQGDVFCDGMSLETAVAFQRALQATRERMIPSVVEAGPSLSRTTGTIVETDEDEDIEDADAPMDALVEDSDPEDDAPAFTLSPSAFAAIALGPSSSPNGSTSSRSTTTSLRFATARLRALPISPLGTPIKNRFPRYSPSKLREAVQRFGVEELTKAEEKEAANSQEAMKLEMAQEEEEAAAEADEQALEAPSPAQAPSAAALATAEETQWESYWSYPSSSPDPLALPSAAAAAATSGDVLSPSSKRRALLSRLLASTPRLTPPPALPSSRRDIPLSSSLSPLPSSAAEGEDNDGVAGEGEGQVIADSDDEMAAGEDDEDGGEESFFSLPAVPLPRGWTRDARGELVKVEEVV